MSSALMNRIAVGFYYCIARAYIMSIHNVVPLKEFCILVTGAHGDVAYRRKTTRSLGVVYMAMLSEEVEE